MPTAWLADGLPAGSGVCHGMKHHGPAPPHRAGNSGFPPRVLATMDSRGRAWERFGSGQAFECNQAQRVDVAGGCGRSAAYLFGG